MEFLSIHNETDQNNHWMRHTYYIILILPLLYIIIYIILYHITYIVIVNSLISKYRIYI